MKGFVDAESGIDYLVAGLGLIPVAGDLLKKAKEAFSAGRVEEAKALLGKAQEHLQHVDADFDDLPSSNQLALTDKGSSHPPELPHSGKQDGDAVAPHEKPSTPEAESTLAKNDAQGSDIGGDDGRMQEEGNLTKNVPIIDRRLELNELFDYDHIRTGIQIGDKSLIPIPNTGNARIFSDASDSDVMNYFLEIIGMSSLPQPRVIPKKGNLYTIKTPEGNFNLRDFSFSASKTGPAWTIDIPKAAAGTSYNPEIKFLKEFP
ncbi:hypothetical protein [Photobacterium sp. 53610]|uniref:hypothetical protein n=1 Tax=Photobacterium sp. 53610 TaxID=3102789 RepID=UPI002EDA6D26